MINSNLNLDLNGLDIPAQYPIDTDEMYRTEMVEKGSFLIKGNLSGKTPALLYGGGCEFGVGFRLNPTISLNEFGDDNIYPFNVSSAAVVKTETWIPITCNPYPLYYGSGSIRLRVELNNVPTRGDCFFNRHNRVNNALKRVLSKFTSLLAFLLAYCEALRDKSAESVCKFFGNFPCPRGEKVSAPLYYEATFPEGKRTTSVVTEEDLLTTFREIDKSADIPDSRFVFSFLNEWGDAVTKVAAVYDHASRTKTLCPMSVFRQHGCYNPEMFRFHAAKTLAWSQRDFRGKEIVITNNVEFGFWNRDLFLKADKLLITFPEPYGRYDLLDLKAVNQAVKVYLMVANFAAETMAEACFRQLPLAQAIHDALDDKSKFSVFMMSLAFEPIPEDVKTTAALSPFINEHKPQIRETCIATDLEDFKTVCKNFEQKVQRKQDAENALNLVMDNKPEENNAPAVPEKKASAKTQWEIRGLVDKGGYIELIAHEKTGKTNFAVTLGYEYITANSKDSDGLIPGRFFTVSKNASRKLVCLDTELGEARFNVIRDRVKGAYLPKKSKVAAALDANFIYHDLFKDGIPYAKRENHQHVLDLIVAAENEGTPGPVGLVILDTRRGFTHDQVGLEPQFSELIRKIRGLGCAVFVCHHMNEKNEAAGNYSVTTAKTGMIKMSRGYVSSKEDREKCNLTHPVQFKLSSYGAYQTALDNEAFYAKCEDGRWTLMEMVENTSGLNTQFRPVKFDEKAILRELVKDYQRGAKLTKAEIAEYLGITDDTLAKRLK